MLWDAELTAAAALVVASVLEWSQHARAAALSRTFERVAEYFDAKNAAKSSRSARDMAARYRTAASRAKAGDAQRPQAAKLVEAAFDAGFTLRGHAAHDWVAAREVFAAGSDFSDLVGNVRHVRLFRATDEIGSRLAGEWDRRGNYGNAAEVVRRALDAGKILSDQRSPRGCVLMTMHKAKGKEFDGVLLVEGEYQGRFYDPSREDAPFMSARLLLRVGITRARHRVVILRPERRRRCALPRIR